MMEKHGMTINEAYHADAPSLVDKCLCEAGIDDLTVEEKLCVIADFRTWIPSLLPIEFGPKIIEIVEAHKANRKKSSL